MNIKKFAINEVKVGMYLVGINVSWMKSPFLKHRFMLKSVQDIESLKESEVTIVDIDIGKSIYNFDTDQVATSVTSVSNKTHKASSYSKELSIAKKLEIESKRQMKTLFDNLKADKKNIDIQELNTIVEKSNDSILRNGHALLSMFHVNKNGNAIIDYAFNTMTIALLLGQRMDMSEQELSDLGTAALMMDVGWLMLPTELFQQGYTYTDDEFDLVKQHVDFSVELLEASHFSSDIIELVAKHHERIDGSGYFQYDNDDISLGSQILSLTDHYNSQVFGCYDSGKVIPATALRSIYKKISDGSHEGGLVELLVQLLGIFPISSAVKLNTEEKAVVTRVNWRDALKPTVNIFYNKSGQALLKPIIIDLFKQNESQTQRIIKGVLNPLNKADDPARILNYSV